MKFLLFAHLFTHCFVGIDPSILQVQLIPFNETADQQVGRDGFYHAHMRQMGSEYLRFSKI